MWQLLGPVIIGDVEGTAKNFIEIMRYDLQPLDLDVKDEANKC